MHKPLDAISDFIFVWDEVRACDIILVPGGTWPELMERAAELYFRGIAPIILTSGRYNNKLLMYESEGEFLKSVGIALGVPQEAILVEDKAANTFENAKFSLKLLKDKNIKVKSVLLVCKAYHSRRALLTYQTIFPKDIEFYISTVTNEKDIRKDNWFLDDDKIKIVMGEVVKIGTYFEEEVVKLR